MSDDPVIAEKAIAQNIGQLSLTALAARIEKKRSEYYDELETANKGNEITRWLLYFVSLKRFHFCFPFLRCSAISP